MPSGASLASSEESPASSTLLKSFPNLGLISYFRTSCSRTGTILVGRDERTRQVYRPRRDLQPACWPLGQLTSRAHLYLGSTPAPTVRPYAWKAVSRPYPRPLDLEGPSSCRFATKACEAAAGRSLPSRPPQSTCWLSLARIGKSTSGSATRRSPRTHPAAFGRIPN